MKLNDALWGAVLMLFSVALLVHVQSFPKIPGQQVGPSALPGALAVGLFVCGAILLWRGLRERARAGAGAAAWIERPEWFGARRQVVAFAVLVGVNLVYLLVVDRLGFVITGIVYLTALMAVLRVPPLRALVIAVVMTLAIHYCFYKLLRVPLPWGVLQGVAW
jgi:putative tricarboxylic transport membrane protein